jgi:multimeric flavodoxin WrbA
MTDVRKGQMPPELTREQFSRRFRNNFYDPAFREAEDAVAKLEEIAWGAYKEDRKAPITAKAGEGFADPDYDLSVEWRETSDRLKAAEQKQKAAETKSRVLLICGSPRSDGTCPGEISKTYRLTMLARDVLEEAKLEVDVLDLSLIPANYEKHIHPCKGCVSTAMPLCHWPCSCYPNHAFAQVNDWMAEIYEQWVSAHAVIIVAPTHWYMAPSVLKLMMDRLVCADGGNPDPTATGGKDPEKAKQLEMKGWDYPKHLAGRIYGLAIHGDVAGIEGTRRGLSDWLDWMGLIDAGATSRLDRYIGYFEPYATSHQALDKDTAVQEETRNVARAVAEAVGLMRAGKLPQADGRLKDPRPK